ncbi:hypothetical protein GCM10009760_47440 [Kitasatospora kazusensis]|uniref:Lipoprotein n=1 Tax=Kitasatospora kazusensis TaxID=407974 RepID=A0ABN3A103_9ACTN
MRTWFSRTALGRGAVLAVLAVASVAGCSDAGQLHDAGPVRPVAVHPSPEPLWAAAVTTPTPTPEATAGRPAPSPVPGITVPGDDLRGVGARTVLAKDPALRSDERAALDGCPGCLVQPERYRDLGGDGREELITAVLTGSERAYLHVYALKEHGILPVLDIPVLPGFTADTVGQNLVVHEPNGPNTRTDTTYQWTAGVLAVVDRRIKGTDPAPGAPDCPPGTSVTPSAASPSAVPEGVATTDHPEPQVSGAPAARTPAPVRSP